MSDSSSLNKQKILHALSGVMLPHATTSVVEAGLVSGVTVNDGHVGFLLKGGAELENIRKQCEEVILRLDGVERVTAVLTAHQDAPPPKRAQAKWNREPVAGVKKLIAVASGKGGVGKSSVAVLLAHALVKQGKQVGILDADIYGPSIPTMLGISGRAEVKDGKLVPEVAHGIVAMSLGMIAGEQAAVMRAPMATKALAQMLRGTLWTSPCSSTDSHMGQGSRLARSTDRDSSELDVLLIDLPPGTGDVHLSMVQGAPLDGALIVTLASKVAALDAKKSIEMFEKVDVPVLGIIENMSSMAGAVAPFGSGGGEKLASETGYTLLAKLPLEPDIGQVMNEGKNPFEGAEGSELLNTISVIPAKAGI